MLLDDLLEPLHVGPEPQPARLDRLNGETGRNPGGPQSAREQRDAVLSIEDHSGALRARDPRRRGAASDAAGKAQGQPAFALPALARDRGQEPVGDQRVAAPRDRFVGHRQQLADVEHAAGVAVAGRRATVASYRVSRRRLGLPDPERGAGSSRVAPAAAPDDRVGRRTGPLGGDVQRVRRPAGRALSEGDPAVPVFDRAGVTQGAGRRGWRTGRGVGRGSCRLGRRSRSSGTTSARARRRATAKLTCRSSPLRRGAIGSESPGVGPGRWRSARHGGRHRSAAPRVAPRRVRSVASAPPHERGPAGRRG